MSDRPNKTGMPDHMLDNLEALSGYDMSDVRVHRNSAEPAKVGAYSYAQGTNIYLGPNRECDLGHEAWHTVQQKQDHCLMKHFALETLEIQDQKLERDANKQAYKLSPKPSRTVQDQSTFRNQLREHSKTYGLRPIQKNPNQGKKKRAFTAMKHLKTRQAVGMLRDIKNPKENGTRTKLIEDHTKRYKKEVPTSKIESRRPFTPPPRKEEIRATTLKTKWQGPKCDGNKKVAWPEETQVFKDFRKTKLKLEKDMKDFEASTEINEKDVLINVAAAMEKQHIELNQEVVSVTEEKQEDSKAEQWKAHVKGHYIPNYIATQYMIDTRYTQFKEYRAYLAMGLQKREMD